MFQCREKNRLNCYAAKKTCNKTYLFEYFFSVVLCFCVAIGKFGRQSKPRVRLRHIVKANDEIFATGRSIYCHEVKDVEKGQRKRVEKD